ncbi:MAG: outer membrane lipoprotein-sorting protein, partial [Bacteroidales bacterium]|nr:outer membrane lipoprotein-sorting protein [Bacteroidales bacterium]
MKKLLILSVLSVSMLTLGAQTADQIIERIDKNMSSDSKIIESSMTIHGKRNSRTLTSKSWSVGNKKSFTEYLSPASDKGTKLLKLENQIWIYTPSADRTIQISGHMTRQSVMGS